MLVASITFVVLFGLASAAGPWWDYTPAERRRVLGPFADMDSRLDFPCTGLDPSPTKPISVHKLRPADIDYVCAIGDSLTAASGGNAGTIFGLLTQYRGVSWCIGGQDTLDKTITFPNMLRKCNPNLYGYSVGNGDQSSSNARFNVAKPGAVSADMPGQATLLVNRMKSTLGEDEFQNSWKLLTVFIGGNDLCDYCNDPTGYSPENYRANIKGALDIFYAQMPRTIVIFVTVLSVVELEDLHEGLVCQTVQGFLCDCALDKSTRETVRQVTAVYQDVSEELANSADYTGREDFTIVVQPFMKHMIVPKKPDGSPDFSYFAPDCFHFSKKGHGSAGIELWNTIFEPVGAKRTAWNLTDTLHCPSSADGYLWTNQNSR